MNESFPLSQNDPQDAGLTARVIDNDDPRRFTSEPVAGDQRQSYRYPAQLGQKEAIIRRRGRTQKAKLMEESAGGIALEVPQSFSLKCGEQIEVGIYSGWYRSRVVHLQPNGKIVRVGLQRLAVLTTNGSDEFCAPGTVMRRGMDSRFRTFLVAFVAMVAGMAGSMWLRGDLSFNPGGGKNASHSPRSLEQLSQHEQLLGVLEGVDLLTKPEAAKTLQLSHDQQTTLGNIFVAASNELASLYVATKSQPPELRYEQSQAVVNEAVESILCSLTDTQIARWRKMLIQKRQQQEGGVTLQ